MISPGVRQCAPCDEGYTSEYGLKCLPVVEPEGEPSGNSTSFLVYTIPIVVLVALLIVVIPTVLICKKKRSN